MLFKYQYAPNDQHALVPLYGQSFNQNPSKVYISESLTIVDITNIFTLRKSTVFWIERSIPKNPESYVSSSFLWSD